ncbi:MAG: hypothetical protein HY735_06215 [Verrucomicrobia bacterium]|nr:hypothetical protein [Verrucomicrobiota bacterium]
MKLSFSPRLDARTYAIQVSTNLAPGAFAAFEVLKVEREGARGSATDSFATDTARFYRIRISFP